jgi:hypothetical protein
MIISDTLKDKPDLPKPIYNSSGKKVLEYISQTEIFIDLPIIMTRNNRLSINMPYLKAENKLSGCDLIAIRLLNFDISGEAIQMYVQELESKKEYNLEWNLDYTGHYWLWCLADFDTILAIQ